MESFTFTNSRNETVILTCEEPLWLREWEEDSGAMIHLQKAPYQDGKTFIDSVLDPKFITINFEIFDDYGVSQYRALLSRIFNPKLGMGLLVYQKDNIKKEIHVISERLPYFPSGENNRVPYYQKGVIDLVCPNPYWQDPQELSRALRAYEGKLNIPTTFPIEFGISGDTTILNNEGDVETPITIDIQGPVTNPRVINKTTGKYIRVILSLSANDVLHIDTGDRNKRVEIYRDGLAIEKAIGYLDHNSDFWKLDVGYNEIQYIADAGDGNAIVAIAWHDQFTGI